MADETPEGSWPEWVEDWVLPYVDDFMLWPVAFALLAHVLVVIVPLILAVYRYGSLWSIAWLLGMSYGTVRLIQMERHALGRFGGVTLSLVLMWAPAAPLAWWAQQTGFL
jgi:hypothetical protein